MEETGEETLTAFDLPGKHRKRMKSTNGLERFHQELERRTRVVRIFPNRASCLRLVTALAMEQSEEWLTGRRYLDLALLEDESEAPKETGVAGEEAVMVVPFSPRRGILQNFLGSTLPAPWPSLTDPSGDDSIP